MIVIGLFPGFIVVFLIVSVLFSVFWFSSISVAFIFSWSVFVVVWFCAIICVFILYTSNGVYLVSMLNFSVAVYFPGCRCCSIMIV